MKKIILSALLALTTGCSSYTLLPEPYETRYFSVTNMLPNKTFDPSFDKKCKDIEQSTVWWWTEKSLLVGSLGYALEFNKEDKYNVVAKSKDNKKRFLDGKYRLTMPLSTINKCTIDEKTYKKQKEAEKIAAQKKAAAIAEQKRKAKEAEAAKAAAEKRAAEKEAARKNNKILTKYGKPLCEPYEAGDSDEAKMLFYDVTEKKKNCLFIKNFKISQTVSEGFLAYTTNGWRGQEGPYFIVKNKDDNDVVDDEEILGLFEYIGTYSYDSMMGPKKVLKFKHVK